MIYTLAMRDDDMNALRRCLFPGDGKEAAALMLCGTGMSTSGVRLMVREIMDINVEDCVTRTGKELSWATEKYLTPNLVERMDSQRLSLVTAHSHPSGYRQFSRVDDRNDLHLFPSVHGWFDDGRPHGALIMLPDGSMCGRSVDNRGYFTPFEKICVAGERLTFPGSEKIPFEPEMEYGKRVAQTFGKGTFQLLRSLKVGVVGCSGTGSIVAELLARNCIGSIVLVDPDRVESKNLNRILNSSSKDAFAGTFKTEVIARAILNMGMNVLTETITAETSALEAINALKTCDVIFGCVDSAEGRYHMDCLAAAYLIPYFDVGVRLDANGTGGISHAVASANYVRPGGKSLLERGIYSSEQVRAEGLRRNNPEYYKQQRAAGYLAAIGEDHPAVISLNMQAACLAINDFLARLHGFRLDENAEFAIQKFSLTHGVYSFEETCGDTSFFRKYLGSGDHCELLRGF